MTITLDPKARVLAKATGVDKLGQKTLAQLDGDGDGVVKLTDVRKLVKSAGLAKDFVLSRDDRAAIAAALGAPAASSTRSTGVSSAIAARTGTAKKLEDVYMSPEFSKSRDGLVVAMQTTTYNAGTVGGDIDRSTTLRGVHAKAVDVLYYSTSGKTGLPNSSGGGGGTNLYRGSAHGGGFLALVADDKRGLVLVDVPGRQFAAGAEPAVRELSSLAALAKDTVVKAAAKKAGLDPKTITVTLTDVHLSAAFADSKTNTLAFDATLEDAKGKRSKQTFSTFLYGDLSKSSAKLEIDALEMGVEHSWGWLSPPSSKRDEPKAVDPARNDRVRDRGYSGGGEASSRRVSGGGGEASSYGGGGSSGGGE